MSKSLQAAVVAAAFAAGSAGTYTLTPDPDASGAVYFSPHDAAHPEWSPLLALVNLIGSAKKEIRLQAYNFTSEPIAAALIAAHHRGVDVQIILDARDNRTNKHSQARKCAEAGIPVYLDSKHRIQHSKAMTVDRRWVRTGSYNDSESAEHANSEDMPIIQSKALAAKYLANWDSHRGHSETFPAPAHSVK